MSLRDQFERQALINQMLNRQQMARASDPYAQQSIASDSEEEDNEVFELNQRDGQPSINIKITGMLNNAMTKPLPKRGVKPSIDIQIS